MVLALFQKMFKRGGSDVDKLLQEVVERRVSPRFQVCYPTQLFVTHRPLSTVVVDISLSGARFATRQPREAGSVVGLELSVDNERMILPLRVMWDRWDGRCFEHGGTFVELTSSEADFLVRFAEWVSQHPPDPSVTVDIVEVLMARTLESLPQPLPS